MNQNELAKTIADRLDQSQADVKAVIEAVTDEIGNQLVAGEEVSLGGFGKFSVSERSAREGRNPSTGEKIQIAASKGAKFSAASALKRRLND